MKTSSVLLLALLGCGACSKISPGGDGDAPYNHFSFQLLDGKEATDYFSRPGTLPPDSLIQKYRLVGYSSEDKVTFTRVGNKVYFGPFNLLEQPTQPDGTTVNTLLLQLGKRAKPDTVRLVSAPWTRRAADKSGRQSDYPTRFTFYFNGKLAADYDFLAAAKDTLDNFYLQLPHGQIIRLRKK